jgi:hypothetical protein
MNKASEDYLWNKAGESDPEVEHLETLLGSFRLQSPQLMWQETITPKRNLLSRAKLRWPPILALAAVFSVVVAFFIRGRFEWLPDKAWQVSALRGAPRLAGKAMNVNANLAVGQTVETDAASRARVHVAALGVVDALDCDPGETSSHASGVWNDFSPHVGAPIQPCRGDSFGGAFRSGLRVYAPC